MKNIISTDKAPAAIGPYSQAVEVNGLVFTSGVVPIDPATGELVTGPAEVQAERAFKSLKALLEAAGSSTANVIKTTVFISDMNDFGKINEVYAKYFTSKPARSCFAVKDLPKGALCEIEVIAAVEE